MKVVVTRSDLHALVLKHKGIRRAIAAERGWSHNLVYRLLVEHGLREEADMLAVKAGRTGPRPHVPPGMLIIQRRAMVAALRKGMTAAEAARECGIAESTFNRKKAIYKIGKDEVEG